MSVHLWFDRPLLEQPLAALLDSDAHWVFDRGSLTGSRPERGQYLTVVSSGVPELLEVRGRELVERIAGQLTERLARCGAALVARQPRAVRDGRAAARRAAAGGRDLAAERRPRGHLDRHRLAGDDGERDPQRPQRGSAHLEQGFRQSYGVTTGES